jgi:hypothetical protein
MKKFMVQKSVVKNAIKQNELNNMNCCYTLGGHAYNEAEAERMALDKMGPSSNFPKKSILTLAAKSVLSKRDQEIMEEESKLIEKYYKDYYNTPPKNGSKRSRESSTDSKNGNKVHYQDRDYSVFHR